MDPATIKIFLIKGNPQGLRTAEMSNWTGKAVACPRSDLAEFIAREETGNPGVYILSGYDPESGDPCIYIGEAESVSKRIKSHADKDFWVNIVTFVSKDENLTKAHIKYLEGKLIEKAQGAGKASVINSASSGAKLPESDAAEMNVFLKKVFQLLPVLGLDIFSKPSESPSKKSEILYFKIKGLEARGRRTEKGFIVFKGSQSVLEHRKSAVRPKKRREDLIKAGVLVASDDHYIFSKDMEFSSPSTAGSIICGGSTNGLKNWRDKNGKSLKEIEENL